MEVHFFHLKYLLQISFDLSDLQFWLQTKLRDARARQNAITTRLESANNRVKLREMTHGSKVSEAFSRFDLLERRVDFAEGRADALALGAPKKTLEEEIAELQSAEKVDAELAAHKARLNKEGWGDGRNPSPDRHRRHDLHRARLRNTRSDFLVVHLLQLGCC